MAKHEFGEKTTEKMKGVEYKVIHLPKYQQTKAEAIKLLEGEEFGKVLTDSDFWILKNKSGENLFYSGLIITHDALVKINNCLPDDKQFHEKYVSPITEREFCGKKILTLEYRDDRDGLFEVGEISSENCQNAYPFAMLTKRLFDRVVKRKAKLGGIYSDSEAEEFKKNYDVDESTGEVTEKELSSKSGSMVAKEESTASMITMTLEQALEHKIEAAPAWKGKTMKSMIENIKYTLEQKKKLFAMLIDHGSAKDKAASNTVLTALSNGELTCPVVEA